MRIVFMIVVVAWLGVAAISHVVSAGFAETYAMSVADSNAENEAYAELLQSQRDAAEAAKLQLP